MNDQRVCPMLHPCRPRSLPGATAAMASLINADTNRNQNLKYNGQQIDPAQQCALATNNDCGGGDRSLADTRPEKAASRRQTHTAI